MLTAVIMAGESDGERLARTLQSLMPAVLEGVLREALIVDPAVAPGIALVADHAGCAVHPSLAPAVASAKGEWLLLLEAGARLEEGWSEAVRAHVLGSRGSARFRAGWDWLALFRARRPFGRGMLVRREEAGFEGEAGLGRLRTRRLAARIQPAR